MLLGNEGASVGEQASLLRQTITLRTTAWCSTTADWRVTLATAGSNVSRFSESCLGQQSMPYPDRNSRIVLTNSQYLWSKCPFAIVTLPHVLIDKPPPRPPSRRTAEGLVRDNRWDDDIPTQLTLLLSKQLYFPKHLLSLSKTSRSKQLHLSHEQVELKSY